MNSRPIIYRHRIGWLALAVLPMLLIGLAVIGAGYHVQFRDPGSVKAGAGWALMALGVVVSLLSAAALSMRWDLEIDRAAGQVRRTRGCLGMNRSFAYDLSAFDRVEVYEAVIPDSTGSSYRRYRVRLAGKDISVYITEFSDADSARQESERIGSYLNLPVSIEPG